MTQKYIEKLRNDPVEQLRWHVAMALGIAPYCQSDEEVVKCGLHLLAQQVSYASGSFDEKRFAEMKEGKYEA